MNIFKSNLQLLKGTRLISGLFIFASLLVTASIIYSANTYYDIDADKIIINEAQDIIGTQTITGNTGISGITSLGDGGTTNYAQFSATGDLALIGEANLISKLDGLLTLQFDDTTGFVIKDDNGTPV
ncbi:MAG: hypothetical protein U9Q27_03030, partial [Patescibacteria group bacterium]|nr:hypothetical protein [Patescibacteria group bacterium]